MRDTETIKETSWKWEFTAVRHQLDIFPFSFRLDCARGRSHNSGTTRGQLSSLLRREIGVARWRNLARRSGRNGRKSHFSQKLKKKTTEKFFQRPAFLPSGRDFKFSSFHLSPNIIEKCAECSPACVRVVSWGAKKNRRATQLHNNKSRPFPSLLLLFPALTSGYSGLRECKMSLMYSTPK